MKTRIISSFCIALALCFGFCGQGCAEVLYSNDFTELPTDWTLENMALAAGGGAITRDSTTPNPTAIGYVKSGSVDTSMWKNSTVSARIQIQGGSYNPAILSAVTDNRNFFMYRVNLLTGGAAQMEIYVFKNGAASGLLYSAITLPSGMKFDPTRPIYVRLTTQQNADATYLLGEASYDANFNTFFNRSKVKVTSSAQLQTGTSAGVRTQVANTYPEFSAFRVESSDLNVWTGTGAGDWATGTNWSNGAAPNADTSTADFSWVAPANAGTVTLADTQTVGRLIFGDNNATATSEWTLTGGQLAVKSDVTVDSGTTATLASNLTGEGDVRVHGGGILALTGDNFTLSGTWTLGPATVVLGSTVAPENHFGTAQLVLDGATLKPALDVNAVISNNIRVDSASTLAMPGWILGHGASMNFSGQITGSGDLIRKDGSYMLNLTGDNSQFEGDWYLKSDVINTDNASTAEFTGADPRFGKGIVYIQGGGLCSDVKAVVDSDIIATGQALLRGSKITFRGNVALSDGNLTLNSTQPKLFFENRLMGTGSDAFHTTMADGSVLAPGDTLAVNEATGARTVTPGVGTLTFKRDLVTASGSTLQFDVAGIESYDKIVLETETGYSNAMDLTGTTVALRFLDSFDPATLKFGDTFTFIEGADFSASGRPTFTYDFSKVGEVYAGACLTLTFSDGKLTAYATDVNHIPEPGAWCLLLLGACGLIFAKRHTEFI